MVKRVDKQILYQLIMKGVDIRDDQGQLTKYNEDR